MGGIRACRENAGLVKNAHQVEPFADILPYPRQMDLETTTGICSQARQMEIPVALHHACTTGFTKGMDADKKIPDIKKIREMDKLSFRYLPLC